ncbi:hypothetical protein K435DRAFT_688765 [Dendrothele bispora CBS 962.96]|uniref:Uncharacterized protein n=1 Tax=Dendrothele bispora (strain CBS 962.96) TaxID=1314807 RepID=A0A4S8L5I6_DENBC|nr:hypothetical protein K435DRAFT_688765 [Dendrothele bispora CBS 962.96]
MAAFREYKFTNLDSISRPSTPVSGPSHFPGSPSTPHQNPPLTPLRDLTNINPSLPPPSAPQTSPLKRYIDPASDPSLVTPSKRMRFLGNGLSSTASGSFLVQKTKATHHQMSQLIRNPTLETVPTDIPRPDWSLLDKNIPPGSSIKSVLEERCKQLEEELRKAQTVVEVQDAIIEGQNAQLIVQNMGMEKLNFVLHDKENGKNKERTLLFPGGKGHHLTSDEFISQKRAMEEDKKREIEEKVARATGRAARKVQKARIELAWRRIQREHAEEVERHKEECQALKNAGTKTKDLPKGPGRCRLKSSVTEDDYRESDGLVSSILDVEELEKD